LFNKDLFRVRGPFPRTGTVVALLNAEGVVAYSCGQRLAEVVRITLAFSFPVTRVFSAVLASASPP
jgi:hypothetical protein